MQICARCDASASEIRTLEDTKLQWGVGAKSQYPWPDGEAYLSVKTTIGQCNNRQLNSRKRPMHQDYYALLVLLSLSVAYRTAIVVALVEAITPLIIFQP
jgi:hypothetical protein